MSTVDSASAKISCPLCEGTFTVAFGPGPAVNTCIFTYLPANECRQEDTCTDYIEKTLMELPELKKVVSIGKPDGH